jgi:hypothetical protein
MALYALGNLSKLLQCATIESIDDYDFAEAEKRSWYFIDLCLFRGLFVENDERNVIDELVKFK